MSPSTNPTSTVMAPAPNSLTTTPHTAHRAHNIHESPAPHNAHTAYPLIMPVVAATPPKVIHTSVSLERMNIQEFGSSLLMVRRKRSHASIRGGPVRQFFLRLFRRRSRAKYHFSKAQLSRRNAKGAKALRRRSTAIVPDYSSSTSSSPIVGRPKGKVRQYRVRPFQLFNIRPYPVRKQTPPLPTSGHAISSPKQVTKYVGIDPTGSPEMLSIKSRHSSGALRIHAISGRPVSESSLIQSITDSPTSLQLGSHLNRYLHTKYPHQQIASRDRDGHSVSDDDAVHSQLHEAEAENFDAFSGVGAGITGHAHSRGPSNVTAQQVEEIKEIKETREEAKEPTTAATANDLRYSENSGFETLDALDIRLEMLQRDLDEVRRLKRHMTGSTRRSRYSANPDQRNSAQRSSSQRYSDQRNSTQRHSSQRTSDPRHSDQRNSPLPSQTNPAYVPHSAKLSPKRSFSSSRSSLYRRPSVAKARSIMSIASSLASLSNPSLIAGNAAAAAAINSANIARNASNASNANHYNQYQRTRSQRHAKSYQHPAETSSSTYHPHDEEQPSYPEYNPEHVLKRSDMAQPDSFNPGVDTEPISEEHLSKLDRRQAESQAPVRLDDAITFVNTWSSYLRRAIAVRIVLRQKVLQMEQRKLQRDQQVWEDIETNKPEQRRTYPMAYYTPYRSHSERYSAPAPRPNSQYRRSATTGDYTAHSHSKSQPQPYPHPSQYRNSNSNSNSNPNTTTNNNNYTTYTAARNDATGTEDEETETYSEETASVSSYHTSASSSQGSENRASSHGNSPAFASNSGKQYSARNAPSSSNHPINSSNVNPGSSSSAAADSGLARNQSVTFRDPRDTRDYEDTRRFTVATSVFSTDNELEELQEMDDEDRFRDPSFDARTIPLAAPTSASGGRDYYNDNNRDGTHTFSESNLGSTHSTVHPNYSSQHANRTHPLHPFSQDIGPSSYSQHAIRKPSQSKRVRRLCSNSSFSDNEELRNNNNSSSLFENAVALHPHLHSTVLAMAAATAASSSLPTKSLNKRSPSSIRRSLKNGDIETRYSALMQSSRQVSSSSVSGRNFSDNSNNTGSSPYSRGSPNIASNSVSAAAAGSGSGFRKSINSPQLVYIKKESTDSLLVPPLPQSFSQAGKNPEPVIKTEPDSDDVTPDTNGADSDGSGSNRSSASMADSFIAPLPQDSGAASSSFPSSRPPINRNKSNMSTQSSMSSAADTVAETVASNETFSTPGKETFWMRSSNGVPATADAKKDEPFLLSHGLNAKDAGGNADEDHSDTKNVSRAGPSTSNVVEQSKQPRSLPPLENNGSTRSASGSTHPSVSKFDNCANHGNDHPLPATPALLDLASLNGSSSSLLDQPNRISGADSSGSNIGSVDATVTAPLDRNSAADLTETSAMLVLDRDMNSSSQQNTASDLNDNSVYPTQSGSNTDHADFESEASVPRHMAGFVSSKSSVALSPESTEPSLKGFTKSTSLPTVSQRASLPTTPADASYSSSSSSSRPIVPDMTSPAKARLAGSPYASQSSRSPSHHSVSHGLSPNLGFIPQSASTSSVGSAGSSSAVSSNQGIPKLLREQREISDRILEQMVQEMEELEQRSTFLLAKSQRQFTKLSGDEGAFDTSAAAVTSGITTTSSTANPASVSQTPALGSNLSASSLSLSNASSSPIASLPTTGFVPGHYSSPSNTSNSTSNSDSGPKPGVSSIVTTPSSKMVAFDSGSAVSSPSDQRMSPANSGSSNSDGSGNSGVSAIRLKYSMSRNSLNSPAGGNPSRSGGLASPSTSFQQQLTGANPRLSASPGPSNAVTVDSLAPVMVTEGTGTTGASTGSGKVFLPVSGFKMRYATTTQGSIPVSQVPISAVSPDSSIDHSFDEPEMLPRTLPRDPVPQVLSLDGLKGLGLSTGSIGDDDDDGREEEAAALNTHSHILEPHSFSIRSNAFAPTTGTRISTVAEVTETSSLSEFSHSSDHSNESFSVPQKDLDKDIQNETGKEEQENDTQVVDDDVQVIGVSRSASTASSSFYSSVHNADSSNNLSYQPINDTSDFIQPPLSSTSYFAAAMPNFRSGQPELFRLSAGSRDSFQGPLSPVFDRPDFRDKGKGPRHTFSPEPNYTKRFSQMSQNSQASEASGISSQASSQDSSQNSVIPPVKSTMINKMPGANSNSYILDSPTTSNFSDLPPAFAKNHFDQQDNSSGNGSSGGSESNLPGLHYQPSYISISSAQFSVNSISGVGIAAGGPNTNISSSQNGSMHSLVLQGSASPVPRHIPTNNDMLVAAAEAAFGGSSGGSPSATVPFNLSRGKVNRRRASPSKRHSTGSVSMDSASSPSLSPVRRSSRQTGDGIDNGKQQTESATSSNDSILPLPPVIVPGALPLYSNHRNAFSSSSLSANSLGSSSGSGTLLHSAGEGSIGGTAPLPLSSGFGNNSNRSAIAHTPSAGVSAVTAAAAANAAAINATHATGIDASGSFYSLASANSHNEYYDASQGSSSPTGRGSPGTSAAAFSSTGGGGGGNSAGSGLMGGARRGSGLARVDNGSDLHLDNTVTPNLYPSLHRTVAIGPTMMMMPATGGAGVGANISPAGSIDERNVNAGGSSSSLPVVGSGSG